MRDTSEWLFGKITIRIVLLLCVCSGLLFDIQDSAPWAASPEGKKLLPSLSRVGIGNERRASSTVVVSLSMFVLGGRTASAASGRAHLVGRELQVVCRTAGDEAIAWCSLRSRFRCARPDMALSRCHSSGR